LDVRAHVKYVASLVLAATVFVSPVANAKCAYMTVRARFAEARTVVLVSIAEVQDGMVPWPFGIKEPGLVPGRLMKLRVVKSWKGSFHPGDIFDGWTQSLQGEDAYPHTDVETPMIVFFQRDPTHEIESCNAADPDHLDDVSKELDAIVRRGRSRRGP
jgi:hypothetical protein